MKKVFLGIDWGGTLLKLGIFNDRGKLISKSDISSSSLASSSKFFKILGEIIKNKLRAKNLKLNNVKSAGIGAPGIIESKSGLIYYLPNIKGWEKFPFKKVFQQKLGIPLAIDNDANVAALAELKRGGARGYKRAVLFTLGTGLGSGLILDGKIFRGQTSAAEAGHIPLALNGDSCGCGAHGCVETFLGNKYFLEKAKSIFNKDGRSLSNHNILSSKELYNLALRKNKSALKSWEYFGQTLGRFSSGLVNLLNLELIIITGGISKANRFFMKIMQQTIQKQAMYPMSRQVKVIKSKLGNNAGMIGAFELTRDK